MTQIDITMTAVLRPELIRETLDLINKYICYKDPNRFRLILNIDPVGENIKPAKIAKIAKSKFNNVIYNIADKPSFPKAVKWVWNQSTAPFVLHWEDDMDIVRKIDINNMIYILNKYKKLSSLRLFKRKTPQNKIMNIFNCQWTYNTDGFYLANDWKKQFGLNPILIKQEFIKEAVSLMVDDIDPEKQFRYSRKFMRPLIKKWTYGIYSKPGDSILIDIKKGQIWKNKMKLDKPKGKTFTIWENQ